MNDVTYIEAARIAAQKSQSQDANNVKSEEDRLHFLYEEVTGLEASDRTLKVLSENLNHFRDHFKAAPEQAEQFLASGKAKRDETIELIELAAWASTAHLLLNMDQTITVQ